MKHNCMTILKVSVALILALMMVVGSISTVVAATITIERGESTADSAVPAEDEAAQSASLTDKLVRRVKDDIASTGTETWTNYYLHYSIDNGTWQSKYFDADGQVDITFSGKIQFEFLNNGTVYKKDSSQGSMNAAAFNNSGNRYAKNGGSDNWIVTGVSSGTYVFTLHALSGNDLRFSVALSGGGGGGGEETPAAGTTKDTVNATPAAVTRIIVYDPARADEGTNYWTNVHVWKTGTNNAVVPDQALSSVATNLNLAYETFTGETSCSYTFKAKPSSSWNGESKESGGASFVKDTQWYLYGKFSSHTNAGDGDQAQYFPVELASVTHPDKIHLNQPNTFTVEADHGIPWLFDANSISDTTVYTLQVGTSEGEDDVLESTTKDYAHRDEFEFMYTPTSASFDLYYTLTDELGDTVSYKGTYTALADYSVTFTPGAAQGTITVNDSSISPQAVLATDTYTVKITPDSRFELKTISDGTTTYTLPDAAVTESSGTYSVDFTMPADNVTITATYDYADKVTDADLLAVLAGTKVMMYLGEPTEWSSKYYVNTSNNQTGDDYIIKDRVQTERTIDSQTYYFADPFYVKASTKYYMAHDGWTPDLDVSSVAAGKAYVIRGSCSKTSHTQKDVNSSDFLYEVTNGETTTVTTTFPASVYQGYTASVSSTAAGKSVLGLDNTIEYYVKAGANYYKVNAADGYLDVSALAVGTGYTLLTVLNDGNGLYVVADTDTFDVVAPDLYTIKVKSNNSRLGTANLSTASTVPGQKVTVDIVENMGTFSSIAVADATAAAVATTTVTANKRYTFVMPESNTTVTLTFTDYSKDSDFYYNGYETDGDESSTYYGKRMTEGKLNGQTFSYYHVEGRTGTDQLFTITKGSPVHTSTVFFRTPESWENDHGWDSGIQAQFLSSDNNQLKDWAWMTFDKNYGNGDKVYKISVPYGARYVQFRGTKNDSDTSNYPYTIVCDLNWTSDNNDCFYITKYEKNTDGNFNQISECDIGNQSKLIPEGYYEYFNGAGIYTNNFSTNGFNSHNANHTASHSYIKPKDLGTSSGDYYIVVLYNGSEYTINNETHTVVKDPEVIWMDKLPGTENIDTREVTLYGKDGSIVIDWNNKTASGASTTSGTAYGYSIIADTKLYDGSTSIGTDHDDDGASYESATVVVDPDIPDGKDVKIKTTIASDYRSKYYLKGWCIDGVTYACGNNEKGVNASAAAGTDGVYEMTYTVPADTENGTKIEITPIYYLVDNSGTVTFYLEGYNAIIEKWGNTPYVYPFYGNLNNVDNSFGVYPGQPMVYADGKYSTEIPLVNDPIINDSQNESVKGITISNGYADHVHRNLIYKWSAADNDAAHKQTYDYDDFYKIYEECLKTNNEHPEDPEHPNAIIFRIQDEDTVFNRSSFGGGKSGQFASGTADINIGTIGTSDTGNGWELLVNRYGHAVNIFGDHTAVSGVTPTTYDADADNAIYVVSTGYNANIAGDYGTMWKIYDKDGKLISNAGGRYGIPPSLLTLRGTTSGYSTNVTYPSADHSVDGVGSYTDSNEKYEAIYKTLKTSYNDKIVYITYEKDTQDTRSESSGTGAYRLDGRWYYTHATDKVTSTIGIEVWDESTGAWVAQDVTADTGEDAFGNTASFDSTYRKSESDIITSDERLIEDNLKWNFTAAPGDGYKFVSWQIKYSATSYDEITGAGLTGSIGATANYQLIARFMRTASGTLTITHDLNKSSTGEGTVSMAVNVYINSTLTTLVDGFTELTGSRVVLDNTYIANNNSYYVKVELRTTPMYDGVVSAFGYDKFNTAKSVTATTSPAVLPGSENTLTTSVFSFPVSDLFDAETLSTSSLAYTSVIDETLHKYNFVYYFTDRGGNSKSYTSKGTISQKDYKAYVTDQAEHTIDKSILTVMAPFESNFLKSNRLNTSTATITYNSANHLFESSVYFTESEALPVYHAIFKLPYSYYTEGNAGATPPYKKYTVQPTDGVKVYDDDAATFDLAVTYNTFATVISTDTTPDDIQDNVSKVSDATDVNHAGNNFITAPDELIDIDNDNQTMYFNYWEIKTLKSDGTAGDAVARIYYPDFNYRIYSNYYVEAKYDSTPANSWVFKYSENNDNIGCSVMYLGSSRNQWNMQNGTTESSDSEDVAADKIYSDFIFNYSDRGGELAEGDEIGMILERVIYVDTSDGDKRKWAVGNANVSDMTTYKATYGDTENAQSDAILGSLSASSALPTGCVKVEWDKDDLNNKNFMEQSYSVYSAYGQTVNDDSITFAIDNSIDNYVYRAYAYIKDSTGAYHLSSPAYFCMRYTSNLKYSE